MVDNPSGLNYPGNSNKKKSEEPKEESKRKKLPKSISGEIVYRKKKPRSKIAESFMGDDTRSVGHYILFEVVLPAIKQLISDAASQGVERLLFGDSSRSNVRVNSRPGYTSYNRISPSSRRDEPRALSARARSSHDFSEIILKSREEAEKVRDDLTACVEQFDVATVSDLYDLVGVTGSFQDDKWGWYDLRDVRIRRVREGYLLELPRTQPID